MSYHKIDEHTEPAGPGPWSTPRKYVTYRCAHCRALLVIADFQTPPEQCAKCHNR